MRCHVRICLVGCPRTGVMDTFTGVVTTGIYCRKGCPATPLRRNMLPFGHAAAAEAAGFRPCLRCRPGSAARARVGSPRPSSCAAPCTASPTARSTTRPKTISPTHLGVSARHLRRLFAEHVGATPSEVARSRRAHFARRLLDDTDLPMTQIATAAGFNTVRQMNRVVQDIFQFTPSELRAKRRQPDRLVVDGGLELRVPYRPPLAWHELLDVPRAACDPGRRSRRSRSRRVPARRRHRRRARRDRSVGRPARAGVAPARAPAGDRRARAPRRRRAPPVRSRRRPEGHRSPPVARRPPPAARARAQGAARARRARSVRARRARDPRPAGVGRPRATALAGALVEQLGKPVRGIAPLGLTHEFPTAAAVARADLLDARAHRRRGSRALQGFAAAIASGDARARPRRPASTRRSGRCASCPGIGPWTAQLRRDARVR